MSNGISCRVPQGWFLRTEAAEKMGRHVDTLRRWQKDGVLVPSGEMEAGQLVVALYSEADIEAGKKINNAVSTRE